MEDKYKNQLKVTKIEFLFQVQSARSQHWFKLDPDEMEENFKKRDPDLFKINLEHITG